DASAPLQVPCNRIDHAGEHVGGLGFGQPVAVGQVGREVAQSDSLFFPRWSGFLHDFFPRCALPFWPPPPIRVGLICLVRAFEGGGKTPGGKARPGGAPPIGGVPEFERSRVGYGPRGKGRARAKVVGGRPAVVERKSMGWRLFHGMSGSMYCW